jgi:hypothetical protein
MGELCQVLAVLPGCSIQWGAWSGVGMAAQSSATLARISRSGMGMIAPVQGLRAMEAILTSSSQQGSQVSYCSVIPYL